MSPWTILGWILVAGIGLFVLFWAVALLALAVTELAERSIRRKMRKRDRMNRQF